MQVLDYPTQETVTLPPEGDENLPLGESTKIFIREEIKAQLGEAIDKFNPHGARRVAHFLREFGLAGTLVVAPIALLGFAGAGWYYAFNRVDKEARFQTTTESRLKTIEEELRGLRGDLAKQSIVNHAALPLAEFKSSLPELNSAMATAKHTAIKLPPQVIGDVQQKLSASVDSPDFWPTAAQFISYRSQTTLPDFESLVSPNLPNCVNHAPTPMHLTVSAEDEKNWKVNEGRRELKNGTQIESAVYQDCRFTLDSAEETSRIPNIGQHRSYLLTFRHCQIVYSGGAVTLLTPNPSPTIIQGVGPNRRDLYSFVGQTVRFENCLFLFAIKTKPPREGQILTAQVLAQNGPHLTVTTAPRS